MNFNTFILKNQISIKNESNNKQNISNKEKSTLISDVCENKQNLSINPNLFDNPTFIYLTQKYLEESKLRKIELTQNSPMKTNSEKIDNNNKNDRILKSLNNVFDSVDEKEIELDSEPFILITLESYFQNFWEYFMLFTIVYSAFITPYNLCFDTGILEYELIDMIIEVALILDIFLSFFTQVLDEKENIISSSSQIMRLYLKSWFFLDLITCFPATLISFLVIHNKFLMYLRWFGLVRLLKLIKYPFITYSKFSYNESLDRLLKNLISLVVMINILSCFFIFIGLNNYDTDNWITINNFDKEQHFDIYVASIYYNFLIFTTLFGGIKPTNISETLYTMFYICIVFFFISIYLYLHL